MKIFEPLIKGMGVLLFSVPGKKAVTSGESDPHAKRNNSIAFIVRVLLDLICLILLIIYVPILGWILLLLTGITLGTAAVVLIVLSNLDNGSMNLSDNVFGCLLLMALICLCIVAIVMVIANVVSLLG
jgi:hypothetical protein